MLSSQKIKLRKVALNFGRAGVWRSTAPTVLTWTPMSATAPRLPSLQTSSARITLSAAGRRGRTSSGRSRWPTVAWCVRDPRGASSVPHRQSFSPLMTALAGNCLRGDLGTQGRSVKCGPASARLSLWCWRAGLLEFFTGGVMCVLLSPACRRPGTRATAPSVWRRRHGKLGGFSLA